MLDFINLPALLISFALGMLYVYSITPPREIVYKFPNPYNTHNTVYTDSANQCYKYKAEKTHCPFDQTKIRKQPVTEDFTQRK